MAVLKTQGLTLAVAATYGTTATISAFTNANPGVMTLGTGHGITTGDIFEITSGWTRANKQVRRASTVATNDVTVEGLNTSSTTDYPAGEGVGSIREIVTWTSITGLRPNPTSGGGGFVEAETTEITDSQQIFTPILAARNQLNFSFHWDPSVAWFETVLALADAGTVVPFRITLPSGRKQYGSATIGLNPSFNSENGIATGTLSLNGAGRIANYGT
ncbi:MAG: phage tail protein [Burkholderiales bacterium]|jgi:hypothetical protein|nr:phage tail protein [Burkholderiales bacterium]